MNKIPKCQICKLKCHNCPSYHTCLFRKEQDDYTIECCTMMVSKYNNFEKYLKDQSGLVQLCAYQDECETLAKAWFEGDE